jgi:hypothetical protein
LNGAGVRNEEPPDPSLTDRRKVLELGAVLAGRAWVTPEITSVAAAEPQGSSPPGDAG